MTTFTKPFVIFLVAVGVLTAITVANFWTQVRF